jgi:voltage-gated potassium channel
MFKPHIKRQIRQILILDRLLWLVKRPVFWQLTILVHGLMFAAASIFYLLESDTNPNLHTMTDALYWAISTATTVGYGDIVTQTTVGKWLAMTLMVGGTLFSALYTALFATALMKPSLDQIEREIESEEEQVEALSRRVEQITEKR